jgi:guanylate cyclase
VSAASYGSRYQVWTTTGRFRGGIIRVKELKFSKKRDMSRELMKEFRTLRDLRHDNINSFIGKPLALSLSLSHELIRKNNKISGACVEPMRILLVTDYCAKGSLYDIIENEDIKLDNLFIASLINDLIKVSGDAPIF